MKRLAMLISTALLAASVHASIIGISADKPSENVVAQTDPDGTFGRGFDTETSGGNRYAWGQVFTVGAGGAVIDTISLQQLQDYYAGLEEDETREMKIALFSYDSTTFNADSFGTFSDPFSGQTTQPIYVETFDASSRVATKRWVSFDLTTDQTLAGGTYGFMVWVDGALGTWEWSRGGGYGGGEQLRVRGVEGNETGGGDMNFVVQTIPEPATLGLVAACGALVLFIRRRFII